MRIDRLVSSAKNYILGGDSGQRVTYDTVAPTSPQNGDLWWEPGARYPQPWEFDSSNSQWMSQIFPMNFGTQKYIHGTTNLQNDFNVAPQPIWFYNVTANRVKVVSGNIFVKAFTAQTQGTNFINFTARYLTGTGSYTALYTFPEDTGNNSTALAAGGVRRINNNVDLYMPGNAWNLAFIYAVYGNPGEVHMTPVFWIRMARP